MSESLAKRLINSPAVVYSFAGVSAIGLSLSMAFTQESKRLDQYAARTTADITTANGVYHVTLGPFADKSTGGWDYIEVRRQGDKIRTFSRYPMKDKIISGPQILDPSNEETLRSPDFKAMVLHAGCQLAKSHVDKAIKYTGPSPIGVAEQMADDQNQGSEKFYQAHCLG